MFIRHCVQIFATASGFVLDELIGASSASSLELAIYSSVDISVEVSFAASSGTSCVQQHQRHQERRANRRGRANSGANPQVYQQIPPRPVDTNPATPQVEYGYPPEENPSDRKSDQPPESGNWPAPPDAEPPKK